MRFPSISSKLIIWFLNYLINLLVTLYNYIIFNQSIKYHHYHQVLSISYFLSVIVMLTNWETNIFETMELRKFCVWRYCCFIYSIEYPRQLRGGVESIVSIKIFYIIHKNRSGKQTFDYLTINRYKHERAYTQNIHMNYTWKTQGGKNHGEC